jgi:hypothetical protein
MVSASGAGHGEPRTFMCTVTREQKADLGDIDQVDRIELHVAE